MTTTTVVLWLAVNSSACRPASIEAPFGVASGHPSFVILRMVQFVFYMEKSADQRTSSKFLAQRRPKFVVVVRKIIEPRPQLTVNIVLCGATYFPFSVDSGKPRCFGFLIGKGESRVVG